MNNHGADPELRAMGQVLEALAPLDPAVQSRVLQWVAIKLGVGPHTEVPTGDWAAETPRVVRPSRQGTVSNVAIRLAANSCRTLMISAAAHLTLYQGRDAFTRAEWISCAKEARSWKVDYNQQIPTNVARLMAAGFVFEKAKDVFSISEKELIALEANLADG